MNFTVYKSSAGSGKTYTLVREYLRLCLADDNPNNFKSILAITFTNKAATEMKERVFTALKGIAEQNEKYNTLLLELKNLLILEDKVIRNRAHNVLNTMLHNYGSVSISTIDKFVYKIIRNFSRDLNLPSDFEIELDANVLLKQAIEMVLAKIGTNEVISNFLYEFTETRASNEQNWNIEKDLLDFAKNLLTDESILYLNEIKELELTDFILIKNKLDDLCKVVEDKAKKIGENAFQKINDIDVVEQSYAHGGSIIKFFKKLCSDNLADEDFEAIKQVKSIVEKNNHSSSKATVSEKSTIESIATYLNKYFNEAITLIENEFQEYLLYSIIKKNIFLLALLNEINLCLQQITEEHRVIHISEFNKLIANIVVNEPAPFIYERLGEKYSHFLIDEFQDTSITQFHNLLPLIENSLAQGGFNLLVGDGKQSIYRWRGGEIEQFMQLPKLLNHSDNNLLYEKENALIRNYNDKKLVKNFRSQKQIIEFNNLFFGYLKLQIPDNLKAIYDNHEQEFNPELDKGYAEIQMFEVEKLDTLEIETQYNNLTLEKINKCIELGYQYQDIAIIVRTNKHGNILAEYLTNKKIPIVSKESLLLKNNDEVLFLINCFTLLKQPKNQISKIAIAQYLSQKNNTDFILNKTNIQKIDVLEFDALFDYFNIKISSNIINLYPMYDSAELICRACNLFEYSNSYLIYFLDNLLIYSQKSSASITGFIEWWNDNNHKLSISVPEGINAVNILSIHKSKGLEFPVVIIPYANWQTNKGQEFLWLKLDLPEIKNLKTALISTNKKLQQTKYAHLYESEKSKQILDNINMLYVAFTRAEQMLFVIAGKPKATLNLSKYFVDFIQVYKQTDDLENCYTLGIASNPSKLNKPKENIIQVPIYSNNWREKIMVV